MVMLNDGEEPIGLERVVGERKPVPREPYGARRTRLRECPVPLGSPIQAAGIKTCRFSLFSAHHQSWGRVKYYKKSVISLFLVKIN